MRILFVFILGLFIVACAEKNKTNIEPETKTSSISHTINILKLCPGFAETGKPALVYGAECGELLVKENPADTNSREISLNILRLPAISPAPKEDPLFLIQGGPGGSSVDMATIVHHAFIDVRKNRDLIFVDQRGTGKSSPMFCERLSQADELLPETEQTKKSLILIKDCAEKYRAQVAYYTTPYAARDLDIVRQKLGYEKINLWGGSYGTRVALEYLREFPQHARTLILDGVAPAQIALPKYFQMDAFAALESINANCQAQEKCKNLYGNIIAKTEQVTQRFAQAQAANAPVSIEFEHPRHQQTTKLILTPKSFSTLVFMSLYSRDLTVLLPHAITNAEKGDYRLIASLSALASEQENFSNLTEGMRYSIICNEDAHFISTEDIANAKPFFGLNMLKDFADTCALWPKVNLPQNYNEPISSDVPALLLSGNHDPVTPPRWAEMVAKHLTHSLQIVAPGGNHSISMEGCIPQIIAQFIELGTVGDITTECTKNIVPLPLVLGANEKKSNSSTQSSALQSSSIKTSSSSSSTPDSARSAAQ
jgi:pimeloyl-ACP methyl ester carboxylesterase